MKFAGLKHNNNNRLSWPIYLGSIGTLTLLLFHLSVSSTRVGAFSTHSINVGLARKIKVFKNNLVLQSTIAKNQSDSDLNGAITTHIVFPGGGIFFYWYAGLVSFLRESHYDLSSCSFSGASAGALAATLTGLDVDFYAATDLALKMAAEAGVWDRKSGLQGIWGPMIEDWLDRLLPPDIQPIQGRLTLLVTPIPSFGKVKIHNFIDRQDLIRANLASVHLPWFLDGKLTATFRDQPHIDGSFLSKLTDYEPHNIEGNRILRVVVMDWHKDPYMQGKGGLEIVGALSYDGIWGLLEQGKAYGRVMEEQGVFDKLKKM